MSNQYEKHTKKSEFQNSEFMAYEYTMNLQYVLLQHKKLNFTYKLLRWAFDFFNVCGLFNKVLLDRKRPSAREHM